MREAFAPPSASAKSSKKDGSQPGKRPLPEPPNPFSESQGAWLSNALTETFSTFACHVDKRVFAVESRLDIAEDKLAATDLRTDDFATDLIELKKNSAGLEHQLDQLLASQREDSQKVRDQLSALESRPPRPGMGRSEQ